MFEDTKGVFRSRKSMDRQHNGQKKKDKKKKKTSTKHYTEIKDRATRISLKTEGELRCAEG